MSVFQSSEDKKSFFSHVNSAQGIVRIGIYTAYFLKWLFGSKLRLVPILGVLDGSISALIKMHVGSNQEAINPTPEVCVFPGAEHGFDLLVVGSGPGAAITAYKNQLIGKRVVLLEKGSPILESVPHHSPQQMQHFFESGGQEIIVSMPPIPFAQGSVLGGGSEINSGLYHRLPEFTREEWLTKTGTTISSWKTAELEVEKFIEIQKQSHESLGIYNDSPIAKMQKLLGWEGGLIPRWRRYTGTSFEHFGMPATYLDKAKARGLQIVTSHKVISLKLSGDMVQVSIEGKSCSHTLKVPFVCLGAGTIGSAEILLRSGLARAKDFKFDFHAMVREVAKFPYDVSDLVDIDPFQTWPKGGEFKIGAAVSTPKLLAATLASKQLETPPLKDMRKFAVYYISLKSKGKSGLISLRGRLMPYFVPNREMKVALSSAQALLRKTLTQIGATPLGEGGPSVSTVHIFGSMPLGSTTILDHHGNVNGCSGRIFVRDASLLPSHPGVNPQGPLMHLISALEDSRISRAEK